MWTEFKAKIDALDTRERHSKDRAAIEQTAMALDKECGKHAPPSPDAAWRENCEVFLVAIVVALAVRTYFLQPFTIPTGSMQPTLNGIKWFNRSRREKPPKSCHAHSSKRAGGGAVISMWWRRTIS